METHAPPPAPVRRIEREELRDRLARHEDFKLVMATGEFGFRVKHIPGSVHFKNTEAMLAALGKDEPIVVYCSNFDCHASLALIQKLRDHGYTKVSHYAGGVIDWEEAGLPIEGEWAPVA